MRWLKYWNFSFSIDANSGIDADSGDDTYSGVNAGSDNPRVDGPERVGRGPLRRPGSG